MPDRLAGIIRQEISFGDIGDVFRSCVLGEQMIKRLILVRPTSSGIDIHHSSVLLNSGSMSKITPRNENIRWRTICPI